MRYILLVFTICLFSCYDIDSDQSECFQYPKKINKLNVRDLYDTARWVLFNWQSDRKEDECFYGEMELRFEDVFVRNDSLEIYFLFFNPDSLKTKSGESNPVARASVAFRKVTKEKLWAFIYPFYNFSDGLKPGVEELDSPPSDKAIQFIKTHRESLNPCYRELAIKLKILNQ